MSLILIKDIINNKEFVYNSNSFENCIEYLKNTFGLKNVNHSIHDTFCEIFLENETIQKGWIWNSTEMTKQVVYILSFVPFLNNNTNETETETETVSTQTTSCQTQTVSTQTDSDVSHLELQYRYYTNQDRLFEHFDIYPQDYICDPLQICKPHVSQLLPKLENTSSPILDILTKELKSKLQLPNYGLKNTNYQFDLM
jgi:hypothetical protein